MRQTRVRDVSVAEPEFHELGQPLQFRQPRVGDLSAVEREIGEIGQSV